MFRKSLFLLLAALLLAVVGSVGAITYGQPDGNLHPSVGALVRQRPEFGGVSAYCTGTLIAPDRFLTAAHCIARGTSVLVSFDSQLSFSAQPTTLYTGTLIPHPLYPINNQNESAHYDIAIVLLDRAVIGIQPAQLPTLNQLSNLSSGFPFTAVGFGLQEQEHTPGSGAPVSSYSGERRYAVSTINAVTETVLRLSQNPATGNGGTCNGDSGGPNFVGAGSSETRVVGAITITGDSVCRATNVLYRLDTAEARDFLDDFVSMP